MMLRKSTYVFGWVCILAHCLAYAALAQESSIQLGKRSLPLDEPFTITLLISDNNAKNTYSAFPEIPGMVKRGVTTTTQTSRVNNKPVVIQRVTQNYLATREGTFQVYPFNVLVNGKIISSLGITIRVGPPRNAGYVYEKSLYEELAELEKEEKRAESRDEVFFALTTDKEAVFVGEGFTATLALYVPENNKAELKSYRAGEQLADIVKTVRPANCWEENMNISEFQGTSVTLNQKRYTRYKIYQAIFFPFNAENIRFPKVGLKMIRSQPVPVTPSSLGSNLNKSQTFVTYSTQPKTIVVKPLPPHPLRDNVSVGVFKLTEAISHSRLKTGKSFNYHFRLTGEGNIAAIRVTPTPDSLFDFYSPTVTQNVNYGEGKINGTKLFQFQGIAKEAGAYTLGDYFSWIYFNTQKKQYDTLTSRIRVRATGESLNKTETALRDADPLYKTMQRASKQLQSIYRGGGARIFANVMILLMLVATAALFLFKR